MSNLREQGDRFAHLVALRIKAEAASRGILARDLAEALGSDPSTLSNYFQGRRVMSVAQLELCAMRIGVTPQEIVELAHKQFLAEQQPSQSEYYLAASTANYDEEAEAGQEFP